VDTQQGQLVVVGSINHDRTHFVAEFPAPGQTVLALRELEGLGGKGANQAVAAVRTGARVAMVGNVGRDAEGDESLRILRDNGVDTSAVARVDVSTGKAFIAVSAEGENTIVVVSGANELPFDTVAAEALIRSATVVATQGEIPIDEIDRVAVLAAEHGARFVLNLAPFVPASAASLRAADPLIVNVSEAAALLRRGESDLNVVDLACRAAADLTAGIARSAIITLGPGGAVVSDGTDVWHIPALADITVVDTTGAGDAFVGVVCAALSCGEPLLVAAQMGSVAGGLAVTREGATQSYPTTADLRDAMLRFEAILRPSVRTRTLTKEES
jgi:ribokinase